MPKKKAGLIISTYEWEVFDWGLLTAEVLRDQLNGVQGGKPMKPIFTKWTTETDRTIGSNIVSRNYGVTKGTRTRLLGIL